MKKTELVVKSNRLVEASYKLSLNEQRLILYAISRSREEQKGLFPDQPVVITAESFLKQFPSVEKGSVYGQLKEAMDALYERTTTIYEYDDEMLEKVTKTRWISESSYIDKAGRVEVIFTRKVIKYITRLEAEFTSYQLDKVSKMTSAHAIRIYELLAQYLAIGSRDLTLLELRERLQIEPHEYKLTADFVKKIVEPSKNQINKHSDLQVSYKSQKTGRSITSFLFKIKSKDSASKKAATAKKSAVDVRQMTLDDDDDF